MRSIKSGSIASLALLLCACSSGSGDGGTTPQPSPQPQAQSIAFASPGPVTRPLSDHTYTNAASGGAGAGAITYQSSNTTVATVSGLGVVTFVSAGSTTISANKAADAGYLAASANYTLTISAPPVAQPQTIAFATPGPVTRPLADGSYTNAAAGGAGVGAITYQSSNAAVATVNASGVVTFANAGSTTITANKAADSDYLAASVSYALTITAPVVPQPQFISFANPGPVSRPLGDGSYTNVAAGGAGTGAITYQSSSNSVATVSNAGVVTFVAAGTVTITANKAADSGYLAATASYSLAITPPPAPQPQIIAFANQGPVSRPLADGSFVNGASGGAGTGAISYQSSNGAVATVASAGVVTFVAAGTVTITANKAADANYLAATASYSLTITNPVAGSVPFTALLGEIDTLVNIAGTANGIEFLRTTQLDCELPQFSSCSNSQSSVVNDNPIVDGSASLQRDAKWWLRSGTTASRPVKISLQRFGRRAGPTVGSFRGKLWLVGGSEWNTSSYQPVWNSDDGTTWTQVPTLGSPSLGSRAQLVEFNNLLYLIGGEGSQFGYVDDHYLDEVWSTADGITWTLATNDAPWPGRFDHSSFVFDNRLWVVGGAVHHSYGEGNDAWSSTDGINWVAETTNGPYGDGALATVMNGRIWVIGGAGGATTNAVYSSADGRNWRTETAAAPFPGRWGATFKALNGRLYLAAGQGVPNYENRNDVWSSADGITWVEEAHEAPFLARYWQGSAVHEGRIWMIGGSFREPVNTGSGLRVYYLNDVWSTANGSTWREHSPHAGAFLASAPDAVAANGRAWIVGGNDTVNIREEIWSSTNGGEWSAAPSGTRFPRRRAKGLVWFNNELWVSGGSDNTTQFADVWHSANGGSWTRAMQTAAFGERAAHTMVAFGNQMFVIGGLTGTTALADVWRSSDGITWTQATASAPFGPRYFARAAVFAGRLWIFGGNGSSGPLADAWSTDDGVSWRLETAGVAALPRTDFALAVHAGRLFISGGFVLTLPGGTITYRDDVWSSVDGITWTQVTAGPRFSPRRSHGFLSLNGSLWVLGGVDGQHPYSDIWSSDDNGVNWRMRYAGEFNIP